MLWRVALAVTAVAMSTPSRASWWARLRTRGEATPDPFEVLEVQFHLARISEQLRDLHGEPGVWARGRRVIATQAAYDRLLAEACRIAGVATVDEDSVPGLTRSASEREREELELIARGWSW